MKKIRTVGLLAFLALLLVFPLLFTNGAVTSIAVFTLLFAGAAVAWNLFSGYTGYVSLGHAVFYGVGAYALALLCKGWNIEGGYVPFLLLPLVGLIASMFAIPLGWIALRTPRHIFVVITIAMFYIFQLLAYNLSGITNGSSGIFLPSPPWNADFFNTPFYYVSLILLLFSFGASWWIYNSKYGLGLLAIRDDEERALGLGLKIGRYKLVAYVISAFFVGMTGAMVGYFIGSLYPAFAFTPVFDITITVMAFLGGVGTLVGPLLGALLLTPLQQYLTLQFGTDGLDLILFGAFLLAVIHLLPQGIVPTLHRRWLKRIASRSADSRITGTNDQEESLLVESEKGGKRVNQ
jgi:branched-chain amino acid transport system permease protein